MSYVTPDGKKIEHEVFEFPGPDVATTVYNLGDSIRDFARTSMNNAINRGYALYVSTKNTIRKLYHVRFTDIFQKTFDKEFKAAFDKKELAYKHRLIDDTVAQGYCSLGLMTSVLMTQDGKIVGSESAHRTVKRHYRQHQKGEPTSTNSIASIFVWTRGLTYRAKRGNNAALTKFAAMLEKVCVDAVESGFMTKDLALLAGGDQKWLATEGFLDKVDASLKKAMATA